MSGNKTGGAKAKATILAKDPLYYQKMGKVGGRGGVGHEFAHGKVNPRIAGKKGGTISKRGKAKTYVTTSPSYSTAAKELLDESILVDEEFGEGFFRPTLRQRMLNKLRSK